MLRLSIFHKSETKQIWFFQNEKKNTSIEPLYWYWCDFYFKNSLLAGRLRFFRRNWNQCGETRFYGIFQFVRIRDRRTKVQLIQLKGITVGFAPSTHHESWLHTVQFCYVLFREVFSLLYSSLSLFLNFFCCPLENSIRFSLK